MESDFEARSKREFNKMIESVDGAAGQAEAKIDMARRPPNRQRRLSKTSHTRRRRARTSPRRNISPSCRRSGADTSDPCGLRSVAIAISTRN